MNNHCDKGKSLNSSTKCHLNTLEHDATFNIFHKKYFSAMKPYLEELCVKDRTWASRQMDTWQFLSLCRRHSAFTFYLHSLNAYAGKHYRPPSRNMALSKVQANFTGTLEVPGSLSASLNEPCPFNALEYGHIFNNSCIQNAPLSFLSNANMW